MKGVKIINSLPGAHCLRLHSMMTGAGFTAICCPSITLTITVSKPIIDDTWLQAFVSQPLQLSSALGSALASLNTTQQGFRNLERMVPQRHSPTLLL